MKIRRTFKRSKYVKKRPYHKKISISNTRFARSTMIGVIPFIIICIGLSTTLLINSQILNRLNNVQMHIVFPSFPKYRLPIPNISLTLPKITLPTIKVALPQIDIMLFIRLFNPFPLLTSITKTVILRVNDMNQMGKMLIIDIINSFLKLIKEEITVFSYNIVLTIAILGNIFDRCINLFQQAVTGLVWMTIIAILGIRSFFSQILLFIYNFTDSSIKNMQSECEQLVRLTQEFLTYCLIQLEHVGFFIWKGIVSIATVLWRLVSLPFIAIHKQIIAISPFIESLCKLLAKPLNEFIQSVNDLFALAADISKSRHT